MSNDRGTMGLIAASITMMQAIRLGLLNKQKLAGLAPDPNVGISAGLIAVLHSEPSGRWAKVIDALTQEEKDRLIEVMSAALDELSELHIQLFERAQAAARSRLSPEAVKIAESHECERCPAYDECDLPTVSAGGPRKELKPGEWNPISDAAMRPSVEVNVSAVVHPAPATKQ